MNHYVYVIHLKLIVNQLYLNKKRKQEKNDMYIHLFIVQSIHILWRRKWQPTPVSLPGKSHGQRSLVGSSPWGRKELGMTA